MRKNILFAIMTVIVGVVSSYINGNIFTEASYKTLPEEKVKLVKQAAKEFVAEQSRKPSCSINGKSVSLEAMLLAKISNESSYGTKGVGARTNNRGNVHADLIGKANGFIHADNTKNYPVYDSPIDGLKNIAVRLKNRDCKITWESTFSYVKGPRAERTAAAKKAIDTYLSNMVSVAMAYENKNGLQIVENEKSKQAQDMILGKKNDGVKEGCYYARSIKHADYIQIDQGGQELTRVEVKGNPSDKLDVFNCYGD